MSEFMFGCVFGASSSVQTTEIIKFDQIHIKHILLLKIKGRIKVRIFVCIVLLFQEV